MAEPAAIQGNYADFKLVKTRSVCQLVIEIPIERAEQAIKAFGIPQPSKELPVAVARINPALDTVQDRPKPTSPSMRPSSPPRKPATTRAEKARRLCGVAEFQTWAFNRWGGDANKWPSDERYQMVSDWIKKTCAVTSKSYLDKYDTASHCFDAILAEYEQQAGRMAERHG